MSDFGKIVDLYVTLTNVLPWQPDVRFSTKFFFCRKIHRKSILAKICLTLTFSTIFLVKIMVIELSQYMLIRFNFAKFHLRQYVLYAFGLSLDSDLMLNVG